MEKMIIQYDKHNIVIAVLVAMLVILFAIITNLIFNLNSIQGLTMGWILTTVYSLFAYFIMDNKIINKVESEVIIEKPVEIIREVIKEVPMPIQIPIENRIIELVDRIVTKEVPVYIREPIKIKHLNLPKYDYIASSETKRYHKRACRFGKLIKNKYKISKNNPLFFKKKHFKACKMCLKN